jgi:hypothetical protein
MYILNGECLDLPPFYDASALFDDLDGSSDDGAPSDSSPSDEGADAPSTMDSAPSDPLAPCAAASDVFFIRGPYPTDGAVTNETYTNLDASFQSDEPAPLLITITPNLLGETQLTLAQADQDDRPTGALLTPGTYQTRSEGIYFRLYVDGTAVSYQSGTVTIDDVQMDEADGAPVRLHSLLLSYDLYSPQAQAITGCLRFIEATANIDTTDGG